MKQSEFDHVMNVVRKAECLGTRELTTGVRLVGHVPHVAPEAYLHLVFPPLDSAQIEKIEEALGRSLPQSLAVLLTKANGLDLFSSSLSINGLRHNYSRTGDEAWQPFDIITPNVHERPPEMDSSFVIFGSYDSDGSLLTISEDSLEIFRCDRLTSKLLNRWVSLGTMLVNEVDRLDGLFDKNGRQLDVDKPTTPQLDENPISI